MVGNSYIDKNGLEDMVKVMLEEEMRLGFKDVYAVRFKQGAAQFHEYAENSQLKSMIAEGGWTWVVLQEQSEIPGFYDTKFSEEFDNSLNGVTTLNHWIRDSGANTILLMTWGRHTYDKYNKDLYTDFTTMQGRISEGYYRYANKVSTPDRLVKIAPAGLAYKAIYDSLVHQGLDPTQPDNDFSALYQPADDHLGYPTVAGSYLTACVIYGTLTGNDVRRLQWIPKTGIDASLAERLRSVAAKTVADFTFRPTPQEKNPHQEKNPYQPLSSSSTKTSNWSQSPFFLLFVLAGLASAAVFAARRQKWTGGNNNRQQYSRVNVEEMSSSRRDFELTGISTNYR